MSQDFGTDRDDAQRARPSYGQPAAQQAPIQQPSASQPPAAGSWQSSNQNAPQGGNPAFGGYGSAAPAPAGGPSGTPVKQKPIGIILTILGALGIIIGLVLGGVGIAQGFSSFGTILDQAATSDAPNGDISASTSTVTLPMGEWSMIMIEVPEQDAQSAVCSAELSDGTPLDRQTASGSGGESSVYDGVQYAILEDVLSTTDSPGDVTVTCENVSGPINVLGPIDIWQMVGSFGWGLGGLVIGGIGFIIFMAGIITMLVRARRRKQAQAAA